MPTSPTSVLNDLTPHAPDYDLNELLEAGAHFGHQSRKWHPAMAEYIYMEKDGIHIFDLAKTAAQMKLAYDYAYHLGMNGKTVVFVATKRQAREIVKAAAEDAGAMFITARWLGGLLTNWEQVSKSLKRMLDIEEGLATDKFKGYTKFERNQMEKEQNRLERFFAGIAKLRQRPDALFIIDPLREKNAVKEAEAMNVPIIAMVDSNSDPRPVTVAIPANDDAATSIELVVKAVAAGYKAGKADKNAKAPVATNVASTVTAAPVTTQAPSFTPRAAKPNTSARADKPAEPVKPEEEVITAISALSPAKPVVPVKIKEVAKAKTLKEKKAEAAAKKTK